MASIGLQFRGFLRSLIDRCRFIYKSYRLILKGRNPIFLQYDIRSKARYGRGKPYGDGVNPHPKLYEVIGRDRAVYRRNLERLLKYSKYFQGIAIYPDEANPEQPAWLNGYVPELDAITLYGFIAEFNPQLYMEIGSGNSTKFARKAAKDFKFNTKIVSIDPFPRAYIDNICDEVIRSPLEDADISMFDRLDANDILFIDSSHYVFPNSDVVTVFMDILPRLKPGVLVHFHDISIPYDYPNEQINAYYSEQYMLAAYILAEGNKFDILQPNAFISNETDLHNLTVPLWTKIGLTDHFISGCSFWIRMK